MKSRTRVPLLIFCSLMLTSAVAGRAGVCPSGGEQDAFHAKAMGTLVRGVTAEGFSGVGGARLPVSIASLRPGGQVPSKPQTISELSGTVSELIDRISKDSKVEWITFPARHAQAFALGDQDTKVKLRVEGGASIAMPPDQASLLLVYNFTVVDKAGAPTRHSWGFRIGRDGTVYVVRHLVNKELVNVTESEVRGRVRAELEFWTKQFTE
jgi:hypothetical protein